MNIHRENTWTRRAGLLAIAVAAIAGPALAASPAHARPSGGTHCVVDVSGIRAKACFATFAQSISFATAGRVTSAPATAAEAVTDPAFNAQMNAAPAAASDVVISIVYDDRGMDDDLGDVVWTANKGCPDGNLNDVDHSSSDMAFDDRISSFQGYSNCWVTLFENRNFGGASVGPRSSMSYVGDAMNNRASSIQWT